MSELSDAFKELRQEFDRVTGQPNVVKINGKSFPAIIEDVTHEEIEVDGGKGEAGGFRALVGVADHPRKPTQGDAIEARGLLVSILSVENTNSVTWTIVAGDPATE
jgi:hypothetical protein